MHTEYTFQEYGLNKQEVEIIVNLWNGERNIKEEVLVFDFAAFIGDIGGYVGLLLGYSLLSLFDSIYDYIMDMYKFCQKRKKKLEHVDQRREEKPRINRVRKFSQTSSVISATIEI